jgi:DNA repair exonuclease SbcCD nuclease subunit
MKRDLTFLHTADWHADSDPVKQEKLIRSLEFLTGYVAKNDVTAIIHAGDIWERKQSYSDNSGVPIVIEYLRKMSKYVEHIFITKGNNHHDEPGSVALLHQIEPNIHAFERPAVLAVGRDQVTMLNGELNPYFQHPEYLISLVPYPTKAALVGDQGIDNNNTQFLEEFENIFEAIGMYKESFNSLPHLLAFHGNVMGSRLSSGQSLLGQDIIVSPTTLRKAKADYYALGHIHLAQNIAEDIRYSGSIYNKSWGETEQKICNVVSFAEIDPETYDLHIEPVRITNARPMITVEGSYDFEKSKWVFNGSFEKIEDAEYRFRYRVNEEEIKALTIDKVDELKQIFNADVRIEREIIPMVRDSRSEKIMECKSLYDEVLEYAEVVEVKVNAGIKPKVQEIEA